MSNLLASPVMSLFWLWLLYAIIGIVIMVRNELSSWKRGGDVTVGDKSNIGNVRSIRFS